MDDVDAIVCFNYGWIRYDRGQGYALKIWKLYMCAVAMRYANNCTYITLVKFEIESRKESIPGNDIKFDLDTLMRNKEFREKMLRAVKREKQMEYFAVMLLFHEWTPYAIKRYILKLIQNLNTPIYKEKKPENDNPRI
uniref:Uncharacterized protein n=1 Tax=Strigamia maritima TaxID=126957 RepID=T1IJ56_STRMM